MIPKEITFSSGKKVILCEGKDDKEVLTRLLTIRGISGYQVEYPSGGSSDTGGWTKYGDWLKKIKVTPNFSDVPVLVIVADNDDNPTQRFLDLKKQLATAGWCGIPQHPLQRVSAPKAPNPDIVIVLLPCVDGQGNLETLCLQAAYDKWPNLCNPLNTYIKDTPSDNWSISKQSKTRIQCLLSVTCKTKPEATLRSLWQENSQYHFDLNHSCFNNIANFLSSL